MSRCITPKVIQVYSKFLEEPWAIDLFDSLPSEAQYAAGLSLSHQPVFESQQLLRHGLEPLRASALEGGKISRLQYALAKKIGGSEIERLFLLLKSEGIEVIHAHFADAAYMFLPLAKRLGIPLVFSFYGWDYAKLPKEQPLFLQRYKDLFSYASAVIAEGPYGADMIVSLGCPRHKVKVVPLGLPLPSFTKTTTSSNPNSIVQAAAFTEKKAQHITLQAFELIAKEFEHATLTFIAPDRDGSYESKVRKVCGASFFSDRISILPGVPYEKLGEALASYSIFCQPSIHAEDGDSEGGAPVTILLAQAQGVAVVGSTHCDIPFVTAPLGWNTLAEEGNVEHLAKAIRAGLLRKEHGSAEDKAFVSRWTKENFSIGKTSLLLQELYCTVSEGSE